MFDVAALRERRREVFSSLPPLGSPPPSAALDMHKERCEDGR